MKTTMIKNTSEKIAGKKWILLLATIIPILFLSFFSVYYFKAQKVVLQKDGYDVRIHVSDNNNEASNGRAMFIADIRIDGKSVDLKQFSTDEWKWYEEYSYLVFEGKNEDITLKIPDKATKSLEIDFYGMESSGIEEIYVDDELIDSSDMFNPNEDWTTKTVKIRFADIFLLMQLYASGFIALWLMIYSLGMGIIRCVKNIPFERESFSLGEFNSLKGIGIILVILIHSIRAADIFITNTSLYFVLWLFLVLNYGLMAMFLILAGYGLHKVRMSVCLRKKVSFLMKPYITFSIFIVLAVAIKELATNGTLKDFAGYLVSLPIFCPSEQDVLGLHLYGIGPAWFFISLCIGGIVLNLIMQFENVHIRSMLVGVCVVLAYILNHFDIIITSVPAGLLAVPCLYYGSVLKKRAAFIKEKRYTGIVVFFMTIVATVLSLINGGAYEFYANRLGDHYLLGLVLSLYWGYFIIYIYLHFKNRFLDRLILLKRIGYITFDLLYIHAFWYVVFPWKSLSDAIGLEDNMRVTIVFIVQCMLLFITYYLKINVWDKLRKKAKKRSRRCITA